MDASPDTGQEGLLAAGCQPGTADTTWLADLQPIDGCSFSQAEAVQAAPGPASVAIDHQRSDVGAEQRRCFVCNDAALGNNFGVLSCESCKAFFRRTATKEKVLRCVFAGNCVISDKTRRFCSACRLQKCFAVGMKKEMILGEAERMRRKNLVEQNKTKKMERLRSYRLSASSSDADGESSQLLLAHVQPLPTKAILDDTQGFDLRSIGDAPPSPSPCLQPALSPVELGCCLSEADAAAAASANGSCLQPLRPLPACADTWPSTVKPPDPPKLAPQSSGHDEPPVVAVGSLGFAVVTVAPTTSHVHLTPMLVELPSADLPDTSSTAERDRASFVNEQGTLTMALHGGSSHVSAADLLPSLSAPHERNSTVELQLPNTEDASFCGSSSLPSALPCSAQLRRQLSAEQQSTIAVLRNTYVGAFGYTEEFNESTARQRFNNFLDALNNSTSLIRYVVRLAKSIPEFCLAPVPVQLALLKGAALPCILLHLAALYDPRTESWGLGYDDNGEVCGRIPVDYGAGVLSSIGSDGVQRHKALMSTLKSQMPTETSSSGGEVTDRSITALLLVLLVLSPEHALAADAGNRDAGDAPDCNYCCDAAADLSDAQQRYTDLLGGYLQATQSYSRAAELLPLMLHLLSSVKQYGRQSLQRLAAAFDPSRLDPLVQEVFSLHIGS